MTFRGRIAPYLEIAKLVWPLALGMVNNAVMQFVDRAYLANSSMSALEAVLPATTLSWLFLGFFQSVVGYSGVFVAQYHGAKDFSGCASSYRAGMWTALISAALLLPLIPIGGWVFAKTALSPELAAMEQSYYGITLAGGFFVFGQMAATAYFTGCGRTRIVFWVNLVGNLLNVAIDPILIFGYFGCPRMGVAGAAYATVFSQASQFAILVWAAQRDMRRRLTCKPEMRSTFATALRILRFGIPAGGYEILNMLSFTIFVFVTGRVGEVEFAVSNVCFTINYLLFAPMLGFSLGAQTLVGQACGRGDSVAAVESLNRTMRLGLGFVLLVFLAVLAFHRQLLLLFTPPDVAVGDFMDLGFRLLVLMSVWLFFDAADVIFSGALKGSGDTRFVFWWMLVCSFLIWLPLVAVIFCCGGGMVQLWATMIVDVLILALGSWWRWHHGTWQRIGPLFEGKDIHDDK